MTRKSKLSRRDFLRLLKIGIFDLFLLALGVTGWGYLVEPGWVKVESVPLKLKRLSKAFSGIRIAQISDIHMGGWMNPERLQHVVDVLLEQKPDLIVITGDFLLSRKFVASPDKLIIELAEILAPMAAVIPSYAVLGNHDYWTNPIAVRNLLAACNIRELTNLVSSISREGGQLHICGVDDVWEGNVRLDELLGQLPGDGAAILLAHEPDFADISAATGRFDLQLSGHSHGGQVVLPFFGPPVLPYLGQKYPLGLYQVGEMLQYTNRGVGMASLPVRLNCPPEITIFTLDGGG